MPDNAQLQVSCQEGELVVTPKWIHLQSPEQEGGWTILRSAVVEVGTSQTADEHLHDITIHTSNREWHAHALAPEAAESLMELLECSQVILPTELGRPLAPASPVPLAHEHEQTSTSMAPPDQPRSSPTAKAASPSNRLVVACEEGTLVITDEQVSIQGKQTHTIVRSAVAGVTNQPRPGNRADIVVYARVDGEVTPALVASAVVPLDALHVIERLGYLSSDESEDETSPRLAVMSSGRPRPVPIPRLRRETRWLEQRRRQRTRLIFGTLAAVCVLAFVAGIAFNGINAASPAAAPAQPLARATRTHPRATSLPTRQPTPAPRATPTATLNALAPVPLAFTCATAVSHAYGRVCVHTRPGAALTITVTYCSGFGSAENSSILHGVSYADSSGNHTWSWVPTTDCHESATVYVSAQSNGQHGYYIYDLTVT